MLLDDCTNCLNCCNIDVLFGLLAFVLFTSLELTIKYNYILYTLNNSINN